MVESYKFPCIRDALRVFLETAVFSCETLGNLLSQFGPFLARNRDIIIEFLPEPDIFYSSYGESVNFEFEANYIQCYFPEGSYQASCELAALLRELPPNQEIWRFFLREHLRFLPEADQREMLCVLGTLELNIDVDGFVHPESPAERRSMLDFASELYVREIISLDALTKLVAKEFHCAHRNLVSGQSQKAALARSAAIYIASYLGHSDLELMDFFEIEDIRCAKKNAVNLYRMNIAFHDQVNDIIDSLESDLDDFDF